MAERSPFVNSLPCDMQDALFGGSPDSPVMIMGVSMSEWVASLSTSVSFAASRNGVYNSMFYATCVSTVAESLDDGDLVKFLHGGLDPERLLFNMQDSLCHAYRKYKSHCLRHNKKGKAVCEDRDHWYSLDYDCLPDDVKGQYMEVVSTIMHKMVELSLAQSFARLG